MLKMQIKVVQNKEELVQFILDNYNKDDYSKLFNSVYTLEDIFYFDEEDDIQASLMKLRNEPRKYPQTIILSNKLFDYQHSCISNGVIYLEDSQEQGNIEC